MPEDERFLIDTWVQTNYDKFYKDVALWEPHLILDKYTDVPSYYFGGWYDQYRENEFYSTLRPHKKEPIKLLMGPVGAWHERFLFRRCGVRSRCRFDRRGGKQTSNELVRSDPERQQYGYPSEPPVRLFRMGGGDGRKDGAGSFGTAGAGLQRVPGRRQH